jgi:SAM-dependent methyltransferase
MNRAPIFDDNTIFSKKSISEQFEKQFLNSAIEQEIAKCENHELVPLFERFLPESQPILEAGCGDGRWVAWFISRGWKAVGLDWSEVLCEKARKAIPNGRFESGDMRSMPFNDAEFGSIVALGSIEHSPEGPADILKEFYRVLRPGGIAIITVPYLGPIRRVSWFLRSPSKRLRALPWLRSLFGKPIWKGKSLREARKETIKAWKADCIFGENGWHFYQYQFTKAQMRAFVDVEGLRIILEKVIAGDDGVYHNFAPFAGVYDYSKGRVVFSRIGKLLRRLCSDDHVGHMVLYVVQKNGPK